MICPKCRTENPDGASFCYRCGTQLNLNQIQCPNCKSWNPADYQYCSRCGKPLNNENTNYGYEEKSRKPYINPLNSKPSKKTSKITILFGVLSFVFLFIFIYSWYSYNHYYLDCNEVKDLAYDYNNQSVNDDQTTYSVIVKDAFNIYSEYFYRNKSESKAKKGAVSVYKHHIEPNLWIFGFLSLLSLGICGYSFLKNKNRQSQYI